MASSQAVLPGLINGAVSGFVATLPMTLAMLVLNRTLPPRESDTLPPVEITDNLIEKAPVPEASVSQKQLLGLSLVNHFAYGSTVGALMPAAAKAIPGMPVQKGIVYGLMVWSVSYLGLMPAMKLYPNAKDEPARMNTLMILAHVVWGGVAGSLFGRLEPKRG